MKIRPQMFLGLVAVACAALAGVHFATAQQGAPRLGTQKLQRPDNAQQQQRDASQRKRTRTDSRRSTTTVRTSSTMIRSSVFIGAPVSISGGTSLGTVQDVVLSEGGCVDYVIVNYDNRLVPVPWMAGTFRVADRAFLLTIEENQLAQLPVFTDFAQLSDATFVTKVNTFYKVEERSRDRRNDRDGRDNKGRDDKAKTESDKAKSDKAKSDGDSKQPAKSSEGAPAAEKKTDAPAAEKKSDAPAVKEKGTSETKKSDNPAPSKSPAPKQEPAKKAAEK